MSLVNLPDPTETDACLGGLYSSCAASPITGTGVYAGSVENLVFFVPTPLWGNQCHTARSAVSIDGSINSVAISLDGTVTACAVSPSDEGSELHVIKTPVDPSDTSVKSVKIFETPMFPIRSICFAFGGRVKTKLVLGTDEGKIYQISIGKNGGAPIELKPVSEHGGVKCVSTCPLSGNVCASFCDGDLIMFDQQGGEMENRKILKKNLTPDSIEKFQHVWNPHAKQRLLAIAGLSVPVVLKSGVWATTPIPDAPATMDGNLSTIAWSLDGTMLAAVTAAGTVAVYEFSQITGPVLKIRALSSTNTIMSVCWSYHNNAHSVNAIGLNGVRTSIPLTDETCEVLKKNLKIDLVSLLHASKEATAVHIDSGLQEAEVSSEESDSDSDSDASEKAESVDESPEQLRQELEELVDAPPGIEKEVPMEEESQDDPKEESRKSTSHFDRQFTFQPGASTSGSAVRSGVLRRIMCWNQFGSVIKIEKQDEGSMIEVRLELDDEENKNFRLKDNLHGWTIASLSDTGLALAVKSKFDLTDKYEDDLTAEKNDYDEMEGGGLSKVCFRPFNSWGNQREWIVPLPVKAEVESVAAGSACLAAIATDSTIRIWSNEGGFLLSQFCLTGEIPISISGGSSFVGDLFFAVSSMRSRSTESVAFQTFLVSQNGAKIAPLASGPLPISAKPGCALCWTGISEDLVPFTCDTLGVVRGLYPYAGGPDQQISFLWSPLLNFVVDVQKRGEGYWPLFLSDREVWCVPTRPEDDYEPRTAPLPPKMSVPLRLQAQYCANKDTISVEGTILMDRLIVQQTRWLISLGSQIDDEGKKIENGHDKRLAENFRKLLEAGRLEKALGGAALAFGSMTSRLMIRMAAALGLRTLETRLDELFNPTATVEKRKRIQSAESTLFPKKQVLKDVAQHLPEKTFDLPKENIPKENIPNDAPVQKAPVVNPFAKKRKVDEEITRNA